MVLVLPTLRLWLLLLNIYGTFKAMKPPPQSHRSARNRQRPSARAMQLRKRELKSYLAVWVVWAMFSTIEGLLDHTMGLVIPFYNELKCAVFLFLLVARAHGAEAIFLHLIHPMLRPYTPAIDGALASLHSIFDLVLLLIFLPFEYISHRWSWGWGKKTTGDSDGPPSNREVGGGDETSLEERRQLRPRNDLQRIRTREADRQGRIILQEIDESQRRVRALSLKQASQHAPQNRSRVAGPLPAAVGLRVRRRVLGYPPAEGKARGPGSSTTGVHHLYHTRRDEFPLSALPTLPSVPITQPVALPSSVLPIIPQRSRDPSSYEIWHPPRSAVENRQPITPADTPQKTPSLIYPPLPSAYPSTPQLSDPLPPPPQIITVSNLATPTPRRVSTGSLPSRQSSDTFEGINKFLRTNQAGPSRSTLSAETPGALDITDERRSQAGDFSRRALEASIQMTEMALDIRDNSSADEEYFEVEEGQSSIRMARNDHGEASTARRRPPSRPQTNSDAKRGKRKASTLPEPLRRSTRKTRDKSSSGETDEFGFTIRSDSSTFASITTASISTSSSGGAKYSTVGASKKPLARTKPTLKPTQDEDNNQSSDEESEKKRPKLNSLTDIPEVFPSKMHEGDEGIFDTDELTLRPDGSNSRGGRENRHGDVQKAEISQTGRRPNQTGDSATRVTRSSMKQPAFARGGHSAGAAKKGRVR